MLINPTLDKALAGIGGIPRGRLTELLGAPTSGMATLALKIMAEAQAAKDVAIYMDYGATFDPDYASRCHIYLPKLLLVRPSSSPRFMPATGDFSTPPAY